MNARLATYWTATILISLAMLSGGVAYLCRVDEVVRGVAALGYPSYFVPMLGACKVLGALVLLAPRLPRLKEWAYAGIVINLAAAVVSHAALGDPAGKLIAPAVLLGITVISWALRPSSRYLAGPVAVAPGLVA